MHSGTRERLVARAGRRWWIGMATAVLAVIVCSHRASAQDAAEPNANAPAPAETSPTPPDSASLDARLEAVKARKATVEAATNLGDEVRQQAANLLTDAANRLASAIRFQQKQAALRATFADAPRKTADIRSTLAAQPTAEPSAAEAAADLSDTEVASRVTKLTQDAQSARHSLEAASKRLTEQRDRPAAIRERQGVLKSDLQRLSDELANLSERGDPPVVRQARSEALRAQQEAVRAELAMLETELTGQAAMLAYRTATRDQSARQMTTLEAALAAWSAIDSQRRRQAAERAAAEAERTRRAAVLANLPAAVRELADINVRLTERLRELNRSESQLVEQRDRVQGELQDLQRSFTQAKLRVNTAGLTLSNGVLLRQMQDKLPQLADLGVQQSDLTTQLGELEVELIDLEDRRADLAERADDLADVMSRIRPAPEGDTATRLSEYASELLSQQAEHVEKLLAVQRRRAAVLDDLRRTRNELTTLSDEFDRFIVENLLWARSMPRIAFADVRDAPKGLGIALSPTNWKAMASDLGRSMRSNPEAWWWGLTLLIIAVTARLIGARRLSVIAGRVGDVERDSFLLTLQALGLSVLMALPLPIVLWVVGWQIEWQADSHPFSDAFAAGFLHAAEVAFSAVLLIVIVGRNGLGPVHFRWSEEACRLIRRCLRWLLAPWLVLWTLMVATEYYDQEFFRRTLGRPALIITMLVALPILVLLLRPGGAIHRGALARPLRSFVVRSWRVWFSVLVCAPPIIIALALAGYYYTALQLDLSVGGTLKAVLVVLLCSELLLRLMRVEHRRLIQRASAKREIATPSEEGTPAVPADADPELVAEFDAIRQKSRTLISAGVLIALCAAIYAVWSPILPALSYLENVTLWSYTRQAAGQSVVESVTLLSLGLALFVIAAGWVAARNGPGLLDLVILSRLPLDAGARYAIQSVIGYLIIAGVVVYASGELGMPWERLQWLIAALSVGLGFGLQEVVANFVCGLIILAERPFRIGDLITVGDETGNVSRIHIRATTIINWDRQEIVIPNKALITGQVTNWSLSDEVSRLVIPVMLPQGVDVEQVRAMLVETAEQEELVMDDPSPSADLTQFVDGRLQFSLRAYVPLPSRLKALHRLNASIDERLRTAGLHLAAPRRDVELGQAASEQPAGPPAE